MKLLICSPAFYVFLLIVAAWLCRNRKRWKWTFAGLALFFALFFSLEPIYEIAAKKWSEGYPWSVPKGKTYQYGIVLGGFSYWDWERNRPEFGGNADRLTEDASSSTIKASSANSSSPPTAASSSAKTPPNRAATPRP